MTSLFGDARNVCVDDNQKPLVGRNTFVTTICDDFFPLFYYAFQCYVHSVLFETTFDVQRSTQAWLPITLNVHATRVMGSNKQPENYILLTVTNKFNKMEL